MAPACELLRALQAKHVIADRAYDANALHALVREQSGKRVIEVAEVRAKT